MIQPADRIGRFSNLAGRVGLGQGVLEQNLTGRIATGQEVFESHASGSGHTLTRSDPGEVIDP